MRSARFSRSIAFALAALSLEAALGPLWAQAPIQGPQQFQEPKAPQRQAPRPSSGGGQRLPQAPAAPSPAPTTTAAEAAPTDTSPQTVLIIDGSGSMWGPLGPDKGAKIEHVQKALRTLLTGAQPRSRTGLMSFGQRRKGDCSDVETILPIEQGPAERFLAATDLLNPKGKGPLGLALREAAKQFAPGSAGRIVVVHDGSDNCGVDACAVAAEIAKAAPDVAVDLVSLALDKIDRDRVTCIPNATKGRILDVADFASLTRALEDVAGTAGLSGSGPVAAEAAQQTTSKGKPGLKLSASFAAGGPSAELPLTWTIAKADAPQTPVATLKGAQVALDLEPGSYVVDARAGIVQARETIEVPSDSVIERRVSLDAGRLRLSVRANKAGEASADASIVVARQSSDSAGDRAAPIWVGRDKDNDILLPKGAYSVTVEDGVAKKEERIEIAAGAQASLDVVLGTGRVELSALRPGAPEPVRDVVFTVAVDDPDAPQGRREIARSAAVQPAFTLPAGTYYVTARQGASETRDRIAVGTGDIVKHAITLEAAKLSVSVGLDGAASADGDGIAIHILSTDTRAVIASHMGAQGVFMLPPQRYIVEAKYLSGGVQAEQVIDLKGQSEQKLALRLETSEVTIEAPSTPSGFWQVKDQRGRTVMHSAASDAVTRRLAPGRYVVTSSGSSARPPIAFEVKAQDRKTVTLTP